MKHFVLAALLTFPLPALAQEVAPDEVEPAIDDFTGLAAELEPL